MLDQPFDEKMREAKRNCKRKAGAKVLTVSQEIKKQDAAEIAKRDFLFEELEWITAQIKNDLFESDDELAEQRKRLCEVCLELGVKIPTALVVAKKNKPVEFKINKNKFDFIIGLGIVPSL